MSMNRTEYRDAAVTEKDRVHTYVVWMLRDVEEAGDVTQDALMRLWECRGSVRRAAKFGDVEVAPKKAYVSLASAVMHPWFLFASFWHLFILFTLRVLLRRQWLAICVYVVFLTTLFSSFFIRQDFNTIPWSFVVLQAVWLAAIALTVLRLGLLALTVAFMVTLRCAELPITADFSTWYASGSLIVLVMLVAIAAYGCHTALAGRSIFKDDLDGVASI